MKREVLRQVDQYGKVHRRERRWKRFASVVACALIFCTVNSLIMPAMTLEKTAYCGFAEHQHTDGCYESKLICGYVETEAAHEHGDGCYTLKQELTCGQEESAGHVHTETCVSGEQVLICESTEPEHTHGDGCYETRETNVCGLEEGQGAHTHTEACYTATEELICTVETPHVHSDGCYEKTQICGLPEHTHTLSCFSNPEADVESVEDWERTVEKVELTGVWGEDLSAIAKTQVGYRESEENYIVADDGFTVSGYTRYGAWYGDPYADWNLFFADFCLEYAHIPESDVPRAVCVPEWIDKLAGLAEGYAGFDLYRGTDYAPRIGDVVFLNLDEEEGADHAAIVTGCTEEHIEAVGGDIGGQVTKARYELTDPEIVGYAQLPENPDGPEAPVPSETTLPGDPSDPSDPSETTVSSEPTDPSETTAPSEPSDPGETTAPSEPPVILPEEPNSALEGNSTVRKRALLAMARAATPGTLQNQINMIASQTITEENPRREGTVTLEGDHTENLIIPDDVYVTLDLAGHTLSPEIQDQTGDSNHITVFGNLTVTGGTLSNSGGASDIRGITVASGGSVTLVSSTVTGYKVSGSGAGVRVEAGGAFTMRDSTIENCTAGNYGGGIYAYDCGKTPFSGTDSEGNPINIYGVAISGGTISGCSAVYGGGIATYNATTSAETPFAPANLTLSDNSATYGGGIYAVNGIWITPSKIMFTGNHAKNGGGGYFARFASVTLSGDDTVTGNIADNDGGGLYFGQVSTENGSRLVLDGTSVTNNTAGRYGGGIAFQPADVKTQAQVTMSGAAVTGNRAQYGGGLYLYRRVAFTLESGSISENTARYGGGGFYIVGGSNAHKTSFTMTDGEIRGNQVESQTGGRHGGGGYVGAYSTVTLSDGTITDNTGASHGGGLSVGSNSKVTMEGTTEIARNRVSSTNQDCCGAGLYLNNGGSAFTMTGGSVHDNATENQRIYGVGLYLGHGAHSITNGKIYGNVAQGGDLAYGAGIFVGNANLTLGEGTEIYENVIKCNGNSLGAGIYTNHWSYSVIMRGNASIHDNKNQTSHGSAQGGGLYCGGTLDMSDDASVTNNTTGSNGGGAFCNSLRMAGNAIISGNRGGNGGGVFCRAMAMYGGEISGNRAGAGGGIYIQPYVASGWNCRMTGGLITGNTATTGGGICLHSWYIRPTHGVALIMTGGSVTGNLATGNGGGVYVTNGARLAIMKAEDGETGGSVTGNRANQNGGGVYLNRYSTHCFYDNKEDPLAYALELREGGCLQDNEAGVQGRDIYAQAVFDETWRPAYIHADEGASFGGEWLDELARAVHEGEIDNLEDIKPHEDDYYPALAQAIADKTQKPKAPTARYYAYTLVPKRENVAQVEDTVYGSVQSAVDAIEAGTYPDGSEVIMLKDSREDVVIPENLTVILELAGHSLSGMAGSVLTVGEKANLTVRDTSAEQTGAVKDGKGTRLVEGSTSTYGGGACVLTGGTLTLESGTFRENTASAGSAVFLQSDATFTMRGGSLTKNTGTDYAVRAGSGATYQNVKVNILGGEIVDNTCGGILASGSGTKVTITGDPAHRIPISRNGQSTGGTYTRGVYLSRGAKLTASYVEINKNTLGAAYGAGLAAETNSFAELSDCTISGNQAKGGSSRGGGIYVNATASVILTGCTVSDNQATAAGSRGGGIDVESRASVSLTGCTVSGNRSGDTGGGIWMSGTVKISDTDITDNYTANTGGGIYASSIGPAKLSFLDGARVWGNNAHDSSKDLFLGHDSYFFGANEENMASAADTRAAKNMGLPNGLLYWYYMSTNTYYVEKDCAESAGWVVPVKTVGYDAAGSLVNAKHRIIADAYLAAVPAPTADPVARIGTVTYPAVASAMAAARRMDGVDPVTVLLLKSVTEGGINLYKGVSDQEIILDLQGHVISAPADANAVFYVNSGAKLTLTDSSDGKTGALDGTAAKNCRGIYVNGGSFTLSGGTIRNFTVSGNGAGISAGAGVTSNKINYSTTVTVSGGVIEKCKTVKTNNWDGYGGGIYVYNQQNTEGINNSLLMTGGTIRGCTAGNNGGGIYAEFDHYDSTINCHSVIISGGLIDNCSAASTGGGIYIHGTDRAGSQRMEIYGVTVQNCHAWDAGGIYVVRPASVAHPFLFGRADVETRVLNNNANNNYGGIIIGTAKAKTSTVVENVLVQDNTAILNYGGVSISGAELTVKNVTVTENEAKESAGGAVSGATLEMTNCTVTKNVARSGGKYGGISVGSNSSALPDGKELPENPIHIKDCVVTGNRAPNYAGLRLSSGRNLLAENVTVTDNEANGGSNVGGGVTLSHWGESATCTYTLKDCKIQNNTANSGAGIGCYQNFRVTVVLEGTDISGNHATWNHGGGIYMSEYNGSIQNNVSTLIVGNGARIHDNTTSTSGGNLGRGAGIYAENTNIIVREGAQITDNTAKNTVANADQRALGGGIALVLSENLNLQNRLTDTVTLTVEGGEISGNTADYGGGISVTGTVYGRKAAVNILGGVIQNNRANYDGGGVRVGVAGSSKNYMDITLGGTAEITGNTAVRNGAGVQATYGGKVILTDSARVVGNTAENLGGGVLVSSNHAWLEQCGGSIYGNTASLGQDVYIAYESQYRTSYAHLMDVADMPKGEIIANAWLDENTTRTYTEAVSFDPAARSYPLTLVYTTPTVAAIVHDPDTNTYTAYDTVQAAVKAVAERSNRTGTVILVNDTVESVNIPMGSNVTLNLAGYTLQGTGTPAITCRGNLTIIDDRTTAEYNATHAVTGEVRKYTPKAGENAVGTITGTAVKYGGGVYVDGGNATMMGGRIAGCKAGSNKTNDANKTPYGGGAGVGIYAGSFTLAGGEITDNNAYNGAAVMLCTTAASFTMTGGKIYDNYAKTSGATKEKPNGRGGAIYVHSGTAIISGGEIFDNHAGAGGAIYQGGGKVSISGGNPVIRENTAVNQGGGVYEYGGSFTFTSGELKNNRVTASMSTQLDKFEGYNQSAGGGIFLYGGTLNVGGEAKITGNSAIRGGGIYQYHGTANILNGEITGNTAILGGGLAQNPLTNNNTTWMHIMGGKIYGNIAQREVGNDLYSCYEGSGLDYKGNWVNKSKVPHMAVLAAQNMGMSNFNVWKDDQYRGESRTGQYIGQGQYITASIAGSNSLALTADYFDTEIKTILNPHFYVNTMKVIQTTDGTSDFDDGGIHKSVRYDNAAERERTAMALAEKDLTLPPEEQKGYVETGEVYEVISTEEGEKELHYISHNGKLYEPNQAVEWWAGNDSGPDNRIVRSYDTVAYQLQMTIEYDDPLKFNEIKDSKDNIYQIRFRAVLPCTSDKAGFDAASSGFDTYAITTQIDEHGSECQVLEAYWREEAQTAADIKSKSLLVKVYGMENGATFKPSFEAYVIGNVKNQESPKTCASDTITVSAAPSYNVAVNYNKSLTHTSYYDIQNGVELTEEKYKAAVAEGNPNVIFGSMQGIGITVELFNDPTGKGRKGIELPKGDITFDLHVQGEAYLEGEYVENGTGAPYVWAYKANDTGTYGTPLGGTVRDWNMKWNDVDDLDQTTHYAYNAAPFNSGGGANACYNGGSWFVSGRQPYSGEKETLIHCTVSGYSFNNTDNPTKNSDGNDDDDLKSAAVKAFSAGYVQVLFPLDEQRLKDGAKDMIGYVEIAMDAVVSRFDATSVTGVKPIREGASDLIGDSWKKQLDSLNGYFELKDSNGLRDSSLLEKKDETGTALAQHETRYADNYIMRSTALYIDNREGTDPGDGIQKENHFLGLDKDGNRFRITNDAGTGETPIGSIVYVEGTVVYSAKKQNASNDEVDDPLYNVEFWTPNGEEYNYLTALNILQKFDASVYTPVGTGPVVNKRYNLTGGSNSIDNGAFFINTSETPTNWSWNTHATQSYNLTILYAAKRDGTNWTYAENARELEDGSIRDDGGVAEMDSYREENLLYFKTLDELYSYFKDKGKTGKCVAILYQFRNCCIRSGRTVTVQSKMQVTEDLKMTGDTYCTTNDARGWTTYRPHYKLYAAMEGMTLPAEPVTHPEDNKYHLSDLIYQFNWVDVDNGDGSYGADLDPGKVYVKVKDTDQVVEDDTCVKYNDNREGNVEARPSVYKDGYVKTEYSGGLKVKGTHTGKMSGNTLLLYTLDTSISIGIVTKETGSDAAKTNYDITNGEREVEFQVIPNIKIASGEKAVELVKNGSQKTVITIALDLPAGLTYEDGSVTFNYNSDPEHTCEYEEGDLAWTVDQSNPRRILLQVPVSDIDKGLPKVNFKCRIGDSENADNDIKENGKSLSVNAFIEAIYEEHNLRAAQTHVDTATIQVSLSSESGILEDVKDPLREVGDEFVYTLTYSDTNLDGAKSLALANVLPYNGDGRRTNFTGGYRIQSVSIQFSGKTGAENYQSFIEKANAGEAFLGVGTNLQERPKGVQAEEDLFTELESNPKPFAISGTNDATHTVTFTVPDNLIVRKEDTAAYALYGKFLNVRSDSRFAIKLTLSPRDAAGNLIEDAGGKTQSGGQSYLNDFFYKAKSDTDAEVSDPVRSNAVMVQIVNRVISGTVWYDTNRDGLMGSSEHRLRNVTVSIYQAKADAGSGTDAPAGSSDIAPVSSADAAPAGSADIAPVSNADIAPVSDADGAPDGYEPAMDILGNRVAPCTTDENGDYSFENLAEGSYIVVFRDDTDSYEDKDDAKTPFTHLTVTNLDHQFKTDGNKAIAVPITETPYWMTEAKLNCNVPMPAKQHIPSVADDGTYESPHWNLGVYSAYGPEMPRTGGTGKESYAAAGGMLLILCAGWLLLCGKRKRGKKDDPIF